MRRLVNYRQRSMVLFSKPSISRWRLPRTPMRPLGGLEMIVDWVFSPHKQSKILGEEDPPHDTFSQRQPIGSRYNDVAVLPQRGPQIDS